MIMHYFYRAIGYLLLCCKMSGRMDSVILLENAKPEWLTEIRQ